MFGNSDPVEILLIRLDMFKTKLFQLEYFTNHLVRTYHLIGKKADMSCSVCLWIPMNYHTFIFKRGYCKIILTFFSWARPILYPSLLILNNSLIAYLFIFDHVFLSIYLMKTNRFMINVVWTILQYSKVPWQIDRKIKITWAEKLID